MTPSLSDLANVRELYNRGLYLQALEKARFHGPLRSWTGTGARLLAGRLAIQLGAPKLGRRLHLLAYRDTPSHPEAIYYHARYRFERFGAYSAWAFMRKHSDWSDASPVVQADWWAFQAFIAARMRDFDRAERYLAKAEALVENHAWTCVEWSSVLELSDRLPEALAWAERSLRIQPDFRPGIQAYAHLLSRLRRKAEALEFLREASARIESGMVVAQLAALQIELGEYADASQSLDRYEELSPLIEPEFQKWLSARRADLAYYSKDYTSARRWASAVGESFYLRFAEQLERKAATPSSAEEPLCQSLAGDGPHGHAMTRLPERVSLPVVRFILDPQLSLPSVEELLSRYWGCSFPTPPDEPQHPSDGLPDAAQRLRAEEQGWTAREFTFDVDSALAVLARGVPFTITFVESGFSQSRLVVEADRLRQSVRILDGSDGQTTEVPAETIIKRYRLFGPRCVAYIPPTNRADSQAVTVPNGSEEKSASSACNASPRIDDLPLPDSELYDDLYALQKGLLTGNRIVAEESLAKLQTSHPDHRLTKFAVLALARHDEHPIRLLKALEGLRADFPDDATLLLSQAGVLRELHRLQERRDLLALATQKEEPDPLVMQSLAQILAPLPGRSYDVRYWLRRVLRLRTSPAALYILASQRWDRDGLAEAAELYRLACCLDESDDQFAEAYARVARHLGQTPEVLRLFQQRAGRQGIPIPCATRALYYTLLDRDEPEQAWAALNQATRKLAELTQTPDASPQLRRALAELLLFRAEAHAGQGQWDEAERDLQEARPLAHATTWHRAAARIARLKPDFSAAVVHLLDVVKLEPLSAENHRALLSLLLETEGREAARAYLVQACQRFPHYYPLKKLMGEYLSNDPDGDPESFLQAMLAECPEDAWARRQRALILSERRRHQDALIEILQAARLEPFHPWFYGVLAEVHRRADRVEEAIAACKDGLRRDIDNEVLIQDLLELSRGRKEKEEALAFLVEELQRQPHTGDGLVAYFAAARNVFTDPDDHARLLETLESLLEQRSDLWQAWSLVVQQMITLNRLEEAHALAVEATEQFPLMPKLWVDLAETYQALGNAEGRVEALRQAVALSPGWALPARELAEALEEVHSEDEAIAVLERTAVRSPMDPLAHGFLAERLWDAGRPREALHRAKLAVRHEPGYDWAWQVVPLWAERMELPEEAIELARQLTQDRSGDPRVWLRLARLLQHPKYHEEALAALDRAIALDPRNIEAYDQKAELLAEMGRFDEALASAQPAKLIEGDGLPLVLQGRVAWIEAKRGNYAAAIPPMQALVAIDPSYVWGWQQLAEWYNETGHKEGYLEAASELVRLQPFHPVAYVMRGDARLQNGDREGGKADLREALKITPGFSHAAALLVDAHLEDGELKEARQALAVLQEHAAGPEVAVKQIQLAVKVKDVDSAVRSFVEICEGSGQSPYLLQVALNQMRQAGWEDRAVRALREAWEGGGLFHPWVPLFWIATEDGQSADLIERLRAVDAGLKCYPKFLPLHDSRAELLAQAGRYEEALSACHPPELGDPPPIELRGRAAWVEARRGEKNKAITAMKQLLAEDPSFVFGWKHLTAWYDSLGRYRECLESAEQFVRLEPDNPLAYLYRGEARRSVGDRRGALADFAKAFELDAEYEPAGLNLVTEQLAADDLSGAALTLSRLREHSDSPQIRLREVQLACRQGDADHALTHFRGLASDPQMTRDLLREAASAFDGAGWGGRLTTELSELTESPECSAEVAALWTERALESDPVDRVAERLPVLISVNPVAGREALLTYVWAKVAGGQAVHGLIQRYSELLRAEDQSWAQSGSALVAAKHYSLAAAWLADWRERNHLQVWMLKPLTIALRAIDQDDKAMEVCRAAVRLAQPEDDVAEFRAWLALDLALSGQTAEAAAHLAEVDGVVVPDSLRLILVLAEAMIIVQQAGPEAKSSAFRDAKDHLTTAVGSIAPSDLPVGIGRIYRRVVARLVRDVGTFTAKLWAIQQRLWPLLKS